MNFEVSIAERRSPPERVERVEGGEENQVIMVLERSWPELARFCRNEGP